MSPPAPPGSRVSRPWRAPLAVAIATVLGGCYHNNNNYNYTPVEVSFGVASADFNGDGVPDVAALSTVEPVYPGTSDVKTYLAAGAGAFAAPTFTGVGTNPLYVVATDLNMDGHADLVTASYDDGAIAVIFNSGTSPGTFGAPFLLQSPGASQLAVLDMNGDGLPDIVSADFNVSLFVQTATHSFAAPIPLYSGGANWVAVGDLNGDGAPDVALTDATGVKLLMHTGAASATTYAAPVSIFQQTPNSNLSGANIIAIGHVDDDLLNDLVITDPGPTGGNNPTVNVLLQDPANHGSFLPPVSYAIAAHDIPQSIVLADLLGDGHLDIVIGGENTVTVLLHDPANPGRFLAANVYVAAGANGIAIADVNGDGRPDIVVSNGVTQPMVNGIITTNPGVLLQSATTPGTFGALQDLP